MPGLIWCRYMDTHKTNREQTRGRRDQRGKKYGQHYIQGPKDQLLGQNEDISHRHNAQFEKTEVVLGADLNRLNDDRRTWRAYQKKRRQGDQPSDYLAGFR